MNKKINTLVVLLSITLITFCQEDIVYLKNGSIIKGKLAENDSTAKIMTRDGSIWVFDKSDITRLEKNNIQSKSGLNSFKIDVGFLIGNNSDIDPKNPLSFMAIYSVSTAPSFYFGFGAGFEFYKNTYFPIVANLRYQHPQNNTAFTLQGGYSMPFKKEINLDGTKFEYEPFFFLNPEISYTIPSYSGTSFTLTAGFRYQKISAKPVDYYFNNDYKIIEKYNRLVLRFGYTFR